MHRSILRNTLKCPICRLKLEAKKETTLKCCYTWCDFKSSPFGPFIECIVCHRLVHGRCILVNTPERYICIYCNWMIWNVRSNQKFRFVRPINSYSNHKFHSLFFSVNLITKWIACILSFRKKNEKSFWIVTFIGTK